MAGSDAGKRIGATGRRDAWITPPENLYSPRSTRLHPDHEDWLDRTDPNHPIMIALLASMREHGTDEGEPILYYIDGEQACIADGDRRLAAVTIINAERKAAGGLRAGQPPYSLRALLTKDPVVARAIGNAARMDDKPMVLARRFRGAAEMMGDGPAAAACGLNLLHARTLRRCLALPEDIQAKVNRLEIPADVAARMADAGSTAATRAVEASTDKTTGKVDPQKAKAAARVAKPTRAKTRPARVLESVEAEVRGIKSLSGISQAFADGIAFARGGPPPEWATKWVDSAEATRKAARS